jgi:hypothetical protein
VSDLVFSISLHVTDRGQHDTLTEPPLRERVEWAMNEACSYLEEWAEVSYKIRSVMDLGD